MSDQENGDLLRLLSEQLKVDPLNSKKFIAALGGAGLVVFMFIFSGVLLYINPTAFGVFSGFATTAVTATAGLAAAYIGGQAAVEFKANSTLQSAQEVNKPIIVPPVIAPVRPVPVEVVNKPNEPVPTKEKKPDNPDK